MSNVFGPIEQPLSLDLDEFLEVARGQLVSDLDHRSPLCARSRAEAPDQTVMPFSTRRVTRQALVFEIGRLSAISTRSPVLYSLFSSCAWYLLLLGDDLAVERVLDAALDQHGDRLVDLVADDPADQRARVLRARLGRGGGGRSLGVVTSAFVRGSGLLGRRARAAGGALLLGLDRLRAGDVAARVLQLRVVGELLRRLLHAQAELRLQQLARLPSRGRRRPWRGGQTSSLLIPSAFRRRPGAATNVVLSGSLAAARRNASRASASSTPSIS